MNIYKVVYFNGASRYSTIRIVSENLPAALEKTIKFLKGKDWAAEIHAISLETQSVIL
jgi:hypothetical protein